MKQKKIFDAHFHNMGIDLLQTMDTCEVLNIIIRLLFGGFDFLNKEILTVNAGDLYLQYQKDCEEVMNQKVRCIPLMMDIGYMVKAEDINKIPKGLVMTVLNGILNIFGYSAEKSETGTDDVRPEPNRIVENFIEASDSLDKGYDSFDAQIFNLKNLVKDNPGLIFPFLGVDPRRPGILEFMKENVGRGKLFSGIKIYPSLGFSPFDPVLAGDINNDNPTDCVYKYCEDNQIPITLHFGSGPIGTLSSKVNISGYYVEDGKLHQGTDKTVKFKSKILEPILELDIPELVSLFPNFSQFFVERQMILNHPLIWEKVLEKFKNLRINLAHFGAHGKVDAASRSFSYSVLIKEKDSKVMVNFFTNAPIGEKDRIEIYRGRLPENPNSEYKDWAWAKDHDGAVCFDKAWADDWSAAYVLWDYGKNCYVYATAISFQSYEVKTREENGKLVVDYSTDGVVRRGDWVGVFEMDCVEKDWIMNLGEKNPKVHYSSQNADKPWMVAVSARNCENKYKDVVTADVSWDNDQHGYVYGAATQLQSYEVKTREENGKLVVDYSVDGVVRWGDWIGIYKKDFSDDPNSGYKKWEWAKTGRRTFRPNLDWDPEWKAAYVMKCHEDPKRRYLAKSTEGKQSYSYGLNLRNVDGKLAVDYDSTIIGDNDRFYIYEAAFSDDPNSGYKKWEWAKTGQRTYKPGLDWSPELRAAYVMKCSGDPNQRYLAKSTEGKRSYSYGLNSLNFRNTDGKLDIEYSTTNHLGKKDKIGVYKKDLPENPNSDFVKRDLVWKLEGKNTQIYDSSLEVDTGWLAAVYANACDDNNKYVYSTDTQKYSLKLFRINNKSVVEYSTDGAVPQKAWVGIYKDSIPDDPTSRCLGREKVRQTSGSYKSDVDWDTDLKAAYVLWNPKTGKYDYASTAVAGWNWRDAATHFVLTYPNVHTDVACLTEKAELEQVRDKYLFSPDMPDKDKKRLQQRILYGSDFPVNMEPMKKYLDRLLKIFSTNEQKAVFDQMMTTNITTFLGDTIDFARGYKNFSYSVSVAEKDSKVQVDFYTDAPIGEKDWIGIYQDKLPDDPDSEYKDWVWVKNHDGPVCFDKQWADDWCAAYVSWDIVKNRYVYVATTQLQSYEVATREENGKLVVNYSTDGVVRRNDWIGIYKKDFSDDPNSGYKKWEWAKTGQRTFRPNLDWDPEWRAAYVMECPEDPKYRYLAKSTEGKQSYSYCLNLRNVGGQLVVDYNSTSPTSCIDRIGIYKRGLPGNPLIQNACNKLVTQLKGKNPRTYHSNLEANGRWVTAVSAQKCGGKHEYEYVVSTGAQEYSLILLNKNDKPVVEYSTDGAVREKAWIGIYKGKVPNDPDSKCVHKHQIEQASGSLLPDVDWSDDLTAAYVLWNDKTEKYGYAAVVSAKDIP